MQTKTKTNQPPQPNMTREYRRELRDLTRQLTQLHRAKTKLTRTAKADITAADRIHRSAIAIIQRNTKAQAKSLDKEITTLTKRAAILQGRLS